MSTFVVVNTYTYAVTYVTDKLLTSIKTIVRLSGLSPDRLTTQWTVLERGVTTWLRTQDLEQLHLEVYHPTTDQLVGRWDFQIFYGFFSMGWRGSAAHWHNYEAAYLLLAGLATPLVVSVHTVVSFDFSIAILPGWHATIFPPYFVAGAIYSGFAMVMTLAIPLRKFYHLEDFITMRHIHNMTKVMLATGMIVAYGYANEAFFAWYSSNAYEAYMMLNRMTGPYAVFYWTLIAINAVMIQLFWFRRIRENIPLLFVLSLLVNVGMWLERFNIVVTSLSHDRLPFSWRLYSPSWVEWGMTFGSFGWFFFWFLLSLKLLPVVSIAEMKEELAHAAHAPHGGPAGEAAHAS